MNTLYIDYTYIHNCKTVSIKIEGCCVLLILTDTVINAVKKNQEVIFKTPVICPMDQLNS